MGVWQGTINKKLRTSAITMHVMRKDAYVAVDRIGQERQMRVTLETAMSQVSACKIVNQTYPELKLFKVEAAIVARKPVSGRFR